MNSAGERPRVAAAYSVARRHIDFYRNRKRERARDKMDPSRLTKLTKLDKFIMRSISISFFLSMSIQIGTFRRSCIFNITTYIFFIVTS